MTLLSFDQSTTKTGYALFTDGNLINHGVLDVHKEKDGKTRLKMMCVMINNLINKFNPDFIVIEDISLHSSVPVMGLLANLQGAVMQSCFLNDIEFQKYPPTTWRRILGIGKGNAERHECKERAMQYVREQFSLNVSDDCADAICIGNAHLINVKEKENEDNDKK